MVEDSEAIEGGYVLLARRISESSLMTMPDAAFKVAIWLLGKAQWRPRKVFDKYAKKEIVVDRGEWLGTMAQIVETANLSKSQVSHAFERLFQHGFLADRRTPEAKSGQGFMHVSLCKYMVYQNAEAYIGTGQEQDKNTVRTNNNTIKQLNKKEETTDIASSEKRPSLEAPLFDSAQGEPNGSLLAGCAPGPRGPTPPDSPSKAPRRSKMDFDFENTQWKNITKEDLDKWGDAYPACDVMQELKKAAMWLESHPNRRKKNYRAFFSGWLSRCQEKGGTR